MAVAQHPLVELRIDELLLEGEAAGYNAVERARLQAAVEQELHTMLAPALQAGQLHPAALHQSGTIRVGRAGNARSPEQLGKTIASSVAGALLGRAMGRSRS